MKTLVIKPNYAETSGVLCRSPAISREHFCKNGAGTVSTGLTQEAEAGGLQMPTLPSPAG